MRRRFYSLTAEASPGQIFRAYGRLLFLRKRQQIVWLHERGRWSLRDLGAVLGVSDATVLRWMMTRLPDKQVAAEVTVLEREGCEQRLDDVLERDELFRQAVATVVAVLGELAEALGARYISTIA